MEVSLRKPQRAVYHMMMANPGCYVKSYKKTIGATRLYWRLMTHDHSPLMNITPGHIKPFFQLSLMQELPHHYYSLKQGVTLIDKKKKKKEEAGETLVNQ